MQSIAQVLQTSQVLKNNLGGVLTTSDYCYSHIPKRYENATAAEKEEVRERFKVPMIEYKGNLVCPRCQTEKATNELSAEISKRASELTLQEQFDTLKRDSIITDKTLLDATFANYINTGDEEFKNKSYAWDLAQAIKDGQVFNVWFQSKRTGVGKSHLAMAMLQILNSHTCSTAFIEIQQMLMLIRDSFNNRDSKYTEQYFLDLISRVDILALDDLGSETGNVETQKEATEFTSKMLKAIMNARQGKTTIITTNLSTEQLSKIYDAKVVSRLMANVKTIKFEQAKDKRPIQAQLKGVK